MIHSAQRKQTCLFFQIFVVFCLFASFNLVECDYYVSQSGRDFEGCGDLSMPCNTLNYLVHSNSLQTLSNDTVIFLLEGNYTITSPISFNGASYFLTIAADGPVNIVFNETGQIALSFYVGGLTMSGISFSGSASYILIVGSDGDEESAASNPTINPGYIDNLDSYSHTIFDCRFTVNPSHYDGYNYNPDFIFYDDLPLIAVQNLPIGKSQFKNQSLYMQDCTFDKVSETPLFYASSATFLMNNVIINNYTSHSASSFLVVASNPQYYPFEITNFWVYGWKNYHNESSFFYIQPIDMESMWDIHLINTTLINSNPLNFITINNDQIESEIHPFLHLHWLNVINNEFASTGNLINAYSPFYLHLYKANITQNVGAGPADFKLVNDQSNLFKFEFSVFESNINVSTGFLGYQLNKKALITNVTVQDNVFQSDWMELQSGSNMSLQVTNVTFQNNKGLAFLLQEAIDDGLTTVNVTNSFFINGTSSTNASVIQVVSENVNITVGNSTFSNNKPWTSEIFCSSNITMVFAIFVNNITTANLTNSLCLLEIYSPEYPESDSAILPVDTFHHNYPHMMMWILALIILAVIVTVAVLFVIFMMDKFTTSPRDRLGQA